MRVRAWTGEYLLQFVCVSLTVCMRGKCYSAYMHVWMKALFRNVCHVY